MKVFLILCFGFFAVRERKKRRERGRKRKNRKRETEKPNAPRGMTLPSLARLILDRVSSDTKRPGLALVAPVKAPFSRRERRLSFLSAFAVAVVVAIVVIGLCKRDCRQLLRRRVAPARHWAGRLACRLCSHRACGSKLGAPGPHRKRESIASSSTKSSGPEKKLGRKQNGYSSSNNHVALCVPLLFLLSFFSENFRDGAPSAAAAPSAASSSAAAASASSVVSSSRPSDRGRSWAEDENAASSVASPSAAAMQQNDRFCSVAFRPRRPASLRARRLHCRGQRRVLGDEARSRAQARARYWYARERDIAGVSFPFRKSKNSTDVLF